MNRLQHTEYIKKWYKENPEKAKAIRKRTYLKNKEKYSARSRKYYLSNKDKIKSNSKSYRLKNSEYYKNYLKKYYKDNFYKISKQRKVYKNNVLKKDPIWRLTKNLRTIVKMALKQRPKSNKTYVLIGCSPKELVSYLESKFKTNMTWNNYGEWHVDHIKPCSSFDLTKEEEQMKCFNYMNLQPLWAEENLKKGDKYA
jgi:hypothetical protein